MKARFVRPQARGLLWLTLSGLCAAGAAFAADPRPVLPPLKTISLVSSTVPGNGDVNPYGVAQVKYTIGNLRAGHILVSNFNNFRNLQGTGSTIVDIGPSGGMSVFAALSPRELPGACPGGLGLTTALVVLDQGWVIVGSLPTSDGTSATMQAGCLIVLDSMGKPVETWFGSLINGPWDMTAFEDEHGAKLFVTNVLNGTVAANGAVVKAGTVTRLDLALQGSAKPALQSITVIAAGFPQRSDPSALVIGPTGVALHAACDDGYGCEHDDALLYVADSLDNRIAVIDHPLGRTTSAGTGRTLSAGGSLNVPLGLIATPGGDLLTVNGGNGYIIEITSAGEQRAKELLDNTGSPPGAGALFGLAYDPERGIYFVDDDENVLNLLH
ncbi:MAG: hypothetical protein WA747_15535 [Steroidobacteraceae bacterium]